MINHIIIKNNLDSNKMEIYNIIIVLLILYILYSWYNPDKKEKFGYLPKDCGVSFSHIYQSGPSDSRPFDHHIIPRKSPTPSCDGKPTMLEKYW
jgi:hypothetical protein